MEFNDEIKEENETSDLARSWFYGTLGFFAFGMITIFHYLWTENISAALFWWFFTAGVVTISVFTGYSAIKRSISGQEPLIKQDVVWAISFVLIASLMIYVAAVLIYTKP